MELTELTITQAAELIQQRKLSPVELVQACLRRIELLDGRLNCFITLTADSALSSARVAEAEIQRGEHRGPLHGIPVALKDLFETQGVRTTAGSKVFADYTPGQDAWAVSRLKQAGVILLGKLNMHEIALGTTNVNPHFGACKNPWDLERISGGSSGGSAAGLIAGLFPASLGSDTGGSIRIPASLCGVVGLKPTYGRISLRGVIPLSWTLDHAGPMARSVADVAVLLQSVAGYDPLDPASVNVPVDEYLKELDQGVHGWRVALASGEFFERADEEVGEAVKTAAQIFSRLGAQVQPAELPGAYEAAQANGLLVPSDAAAFHRERLENRPEDFGEDVRKRLQNGAATSSTEYALARRTRTVLRRDFELFFSRYELLLTPATPIPAPLREGEDAIERARLLTRFTSPFNLTGLPALSLPCGFTKQGLPIGLQLVAAPCAEAKLLRAAYAFEQATEWHMKRPIVT